MKNQKTPDYITNIMSEDSDSYFFAAKHINVNCESHVNYSMEIVICEKGKLNIVVGGKDYILNKGEAVFVGPFETHSFASVFDNESRVIVFSPKYVADFFEFIKKHTYESCLFKVSNEVLNHILKIIDDDKYCGDKISIPAILWPLCNDIVSKLNFTEGNNKFEDELLNALSYINQHFTEKITLSDVSKAVGLHHVTLSKKLNEHAKTSFNTYLNYKRCTLAAKLILNNNVSCTEASFQAGFGSIRSFNRIFLDIFKVTPTEFKNDPNKFTNTFYH